MAVSFWRRKCRRMKACELYTKNNEADGNFSLPSLSLNLMTKKLTSKNAATYLLDGTFSNKSIL